MNYQFIISSYQLPTINVCVDAYVGPASKIEEWMNELYLIEFEVADGWG